MLQTIELIDFKNHVDTKIRLQRLTLLVGPNGAGKTGVLQGIALGAAALRDSRALAPRGSDAALARRGSPGYRLSLAGDALPDGGNTAEPIPWVLDVSSTDAVSFCLGGQQAALGDREGRLFADPPLGHEAKTAVGPARLLRLDAPRLAAPSFLGSVDAELAPNGSGLASTIAHLMTYERERFLTLEQQLIELVPSVLSIRVRRVEMKRPTRGTSTTQGDLDRERQCLETTPLSVLKGRGQETGLADYLGEAATRLLPLLDPGANAGVPKGADA